MSLGRVYTADSTTVSVTTTTATLIFYGTATSTQPFDVEAIRIGIVSGGGVSYPPNSSVLCQLMHVSAITGGGAAAAAASHNPTDIAANTLFTTGHTTPISAFTPGAVLWGMPVPFSAGAGWGEWVSPGAEWRTSVSTLTGIVITCSSAGTATLFNAQMVISE